jgi:hypothetical protein
MNQFKAKTASSQPTGRGVVLFGLDPSGKPRAARFAAGQAALASKAAALMGLSAGQITSDELADIADRLPAGRIYANGRGFVPYVRRDSYGKVAEAFAGQSDRSRKLCGEPSDSTAELVATGFPRSWDEIAPGHLVLAQESLVAGWWEAIVIEKTADVLTLRWQNYPREPKVTRHVAAVGRRSSVASS